MHVLRDTVDVLEFKLGRINNSLAGLRKRSAAKKPWTCSAVVPNGLSLASPLAVFKKGRRLTCASGAEDPLVPTELDWSVSRPVQSGDLVPWPQETEKRGFIPFIRFIIVHCLRYRRIVL
ncbi:hypothetical protein RJZ90_007093 [Blastomyces dermatitidis]